MLPTLPDLEVQVISGSAASLIGRGMAFPGVLNGARVSFRGVQTNVGISRVVLSPSLRAACKVPSGLRSAGCGKTTAMSRVPVILFSLTGLMKAGRTDHPTTLALSKRLRMDASTP